MSTDSFREMKTVAGPAARGQLARSGPTEPALDAGASPNAGTGATQPAGNGRKPARRKGLSERNRPLWMLIPGGVLMFVIIVVPLFLGIYMSALNLDQYSLRNTLSPPFIGVDNFV